MMEIKYTLKLISNILNNNMVKHNLILFNLIFLNKLGSGFNIAVINPYTK